MLGIRHANPAEYIREQQERHFTGIDAKFGITGISYGDNESIYLSSEYYSRESKRFYQTFREVMFSSER